MEQRPSSEAKRYSTSKKILINYRTCSCIRPTAFTTERHIHTLSQTNPAHALPFHSFKIHFNLTTASTPRSSGRPLSFRFPHKKPVCISPQNVTSV